MLPDPIAIGSLEWREIGTLLHNLWFYLCLIVSFAVTMLTAHAIIPSLISTGHLPKSAGLLRFSPHRDCPRLPCLRPNRTLNGRQPGLRD